MPPAQTGITGMSRIQAAPASKLTQGRVTETGVQITMNTAELRTAAPTDVSHSSPAAMLSVSDDRKMASRTWKSSVILALRVAAMPASSVMWLMKSCVATGLPFLLAYCPADRPGEQYNWPALY